MKYDVFKNKIVYFQEAILNHEDIVKAIQYVEPNELITPWIEWGDKYATSIEQKNFDVDLYGSGRVIYDPKFDYKNNLNEMHWIYNSIHSAVIECSNIYKDLMKIDVSTNPKIESMGYIIGKYNNNVGRGLHIDCPYDNLEHSYVIYLNDDYSDGDLLFPEIDVRFKPTAGSIVMFKSSDIESIHEALPAKGYKYIIPHFWRMGPSQGFIPYGTSLEDHIAFISDGKNITHDFENLNIVNKKVKGIING